MPDSEFPVPWLTRIGPAGIAQAGAEASSTPGSRRKSLRRWTVASHAGIDAEPQAVTATGGAPLARTAATRASRSLKVRWPATQAWEWTATCMLGAVVAATTAAAIASRKTPAPLCSAIRHVLIRVFIRFSIDSWPPHGEGLQWRDCWQHT